MNLTQEDMDRFQQLMAEQRERRERDKQKMDAMNSGGGISTPPPPVQSPQAPAPIDEEAEQRNLLGVAKQRMDENYVSPEEMAANDAQARRRNMLAILQDSANKIGNVNGVYADSSALSKNFDAANTQDKNRLTQRQNQYQLAENDYSKGLSGIAALKDKKEARQDMLASKEDERIFKEKYLKSQQEFQAQQNALKAQENKLLADAKRTEKAANAGDVAFKTLPEPSKKAVEGLAKASADKAVIANQIDGFLNRWDKAQNDEEKVRIGQQMIKLLNSTQGADAVGEGEARRLASELESWMLQDPTTGWPRLGKNLPGFRNRANEVKNSLVNAINANEEQIGKIYNRPSISPYSGQFADNAPPPAPGSQSEGLDETQRAIREAMKHNERQQNQTKIGKQSTVEDFNKYLTASRKK